MKPFHTVAAPHDDIVQERLTMDVYAADLWDTFMGRASEEYTDSSTFFKKTHMTANLESTLEGVKGRLAGEGGDGFQHIETPFGGGKTHALIAMYHRAREWGAKCVVIVGTAMSPEETVWGKIEEQLDGGTDVLSGRLAPGRERIRRVLERHSPVLILIDELLPYVSVADGVTVNKTNLATQTITFIQQLSEVVSTLNRACVVASFPTSVHEMADKGTADELLAKIRKVSGRKERKIAPIGPDDVPSIIRARLFSSTDSEIRSGSQETTLAFAEYCEKWSILPPGNTAVQYRKKFEGTYPFLPEVVDVLYHKWGSFSSFQRTRGVLRLLSQVVHSLKDKDKPYISLSDFDLKDDEIRRELLGHIGDEFDSVISSDITDAESGAVHADEDAGPSYRGLRLGTKSAITIFMYSFSSGVTNGATTSEVKRAVCTEGMPVGVAGEIVGNFRKKMSYIRSEGDRHLFTSEPNINRLKIDKMDSISDIELLESEKRILAANVGQQKLATRVWPAEPRDIDDSPALKLAIMPEDDPKKFSEIIESKGNAPRIYRNSIFFLCPSPAESGQFVESLRSKIALEKILNDLTVIKSEQRRDVEMELEKEKSSLVHLVRKYYRNLYIPNKKELEKFDLGIPVDGASTGIANQVYDALRSQQQVHEKLGPTVIHDEYLEGREYAKTSRMYESMMSLRGSRRPINRDVVKSSIKRGVLQKTFGIGTIVEGLPHCRKFGTDCVIEFSDNEAIISAAICERVSNLQDQNQDHPASENPTGHAQDPSKGGIDAKKSLELEFDLPEGKLYEVTEIQQLIVKRFRCIRFVINADGGSITKDDVDGIHDTLRKAGARYQLK